MKFYAVILAGLVLSGCNDSKSDTKVDERSMTMSNWELSGFKKVDSLNPILQPYPSSNFNCPVSKRIVNWERRNVLNPTAVVRDGQVFLLYRAQDSSGTSRIGLATSRDGLHFTRMPNPVFYPDNDSMKIYEWPGGCEDPRVVETADGSYFMTYTAFDGKTARLCMATSPDLRHWSKKGLVLKDVKYRDAWSKSGAIVVRQVGEKLVAEKINGSYWMYFGDTDLFLASSTDLENWEVATDGESGKMISVLQPRRGYFDSRLVEPGPFALLTTDGILLIYNGSNAANFNDPSLPKFTYSAGQALFDKNSPSKLVARTDSNFFRPDKPYERVGEVNEVCFLEGLVFFNNQWLLYYGTADSKVAVAVRE